MSQNKGTDLPTEDSKPPVQPSDAPKAALRKQIEEILAWDGHDHNEDITKILATLQTVVPEKLTEDQPHGKLDGLTVVEIWNACRQDTLDNFERMK